MELTDIQDEFADALSLPAGTTPLHGGGFICGGSSADSFGIPAVEATTRLVRARCSASHSPPPRAAPADEHSPVFTIGDKVTFHGLFSRPELSGVTGVVHSVDPSTGRVAVSVSGVEAIRVKPTNLRMGIF